MGSGICSPGNMERLWIVKVTNCNCDEYVPVAQPHYRIHAGVGIIGIPTTRLSGLRSLGRLGDT